MLQPVAVGTKTLADYTHIVGPRRSSRRSATLAEPLQGARVVHVSATAFGGGVSEILYTLVPLMKDVGLDAEWQVIYGREEFFNATKLMHNALQGAPEDLSDEQWDTWRRYNEMNARELAGGWDVCARPRPAAGGDAHARAREGARPGSGAATSTSRRPTRRRSSGCCPTSRLPAVGLPHGATTCPAGMDGHVDIVPPAIDPLAPKNMALSPEDAAYVCEQFGIDVDRPLLPRSRASTRGRTRSASSTPTASSRRSCPSVQLALVGSMATDDPEGWDFFNATIAHADGDPDIHILNNFNNVGVDRGQRVPVALRRADPEVDARGLRPDRHRGDLEGPAVHRRQRRRHPAADRRTA